MIPFTPLKDFSDSDLRSHYCVGLNYTIRDHQPDPNFPGDVFVAAEETLLGKKVKQWIDEGKVRLGVADIPGDGSRVSGAGSVT